MIDVETLEEEDEGWSIRKVKCEPLDSVSNFSRKEKEKKWTGQELMKLVELYIANKSEYVGAFHSASKNGEPAAKRLSTIWAEELTQFGVAVRTWSSVMQKIRDLRKKVAQREIKRKKEQYKTGGGSAKIIVLAPHEVLFEEDMLAECQSKGIEGATEIVEKEIETEQYEDTENAADANVQPIMETPTKMPDNEDKKMTLKQRLNKRNDNTYESIRLKVAQEELDLSRQLNHHEAQRFAWDEQRFMWDRDIYYRRLELMQLQRSRLEQNESIAYEVEI